MNFEAKPENNSVEAPKVYDPGLPDDFRSVFKFTGRILAGTLLVAAGLFAGENYSKSEKSSKVREDIGLDLQELTHRTDTDFSVEVFSHDSHQYVFHVGQAHYRPNIEERQPELLPEILNSQKKIESVLFELIKYNVSTTNVFCEGIVNDSDLLELSNTRSLLEDIEDVDDGPNYYKEIADLVFPEISNEYMLSISQAVILAREIEKKLSRLSKKDSTIADPSYLKLENFMNNVRNAIPGYSLEDQSYIVLGANKKMYLEGKINILPSEGSGYDSGELHSRIRTLEVNMYEARDIRHPAKALNALGELAVSGVADLEKKIMADREEETLDVVAENPIVPQQKIIPLVFGQAHDFRDNIKDYNKSHAKHPLNLIKINTDPNEQH